ncbi:hypothetical protein [Frankia sp. Cj3]|uniref:hypothetical protein n=1 Tax=Frankia sp. Cj3 TaxID=2880976 RepID=UPI001EF5748D|nr:hypothetical protein [Frankia sp. Cj3]
MSDISKAGPPSVIPGVEILDEEPPAGLVVATNEALADLAAGRYASFDFDFDEAFDAFLAEVAVHRQAS